MSFVWSRRFVKPSRVVPIQEESVQVTTVPEYDKISVEEHKDGERLVSTCKEDNEANEVQGDVCQGQGTGTSDQGGEEDLAQLEGDEQDDEEVPSSPQGRSSPSLRSDDLSQ
jgi:hypothetical protein